jgi:MYXO-CTERM domain-containing protein
MDGTGSGALTVAVPAIGGDTAKSTFGVSGKGIRVAILDSGVNTKHPDLADSILPQQHCFTQSACPPNRTSESTSAEDDNGHGSHVAGILTSDGEVAGVGFAPDTELVAVKVNDATDSGFISDWVAGLDWVFANLSTLRVKIVNLSICSTAIYSGNCDAAEPAMATALKHLVDAGVVVFAASGNLGSSTQMSAPACNTGVIAVGATYKSNQGRQPTLQEGATYQARWGPSFAACFDATTAFDHVACFTNSGPRLDLLAPGAVVISDFLSSGTDNFRGTSQASPAAAGVAALMLECRPSLTPAEVKDILQRTGVPVVDTRNGRSYPSIRALEAVRAACGGDGGAVDGGRDALVDAPPVSDANRADALDAKSEGSGPKDGASDGSPIDSGVGSGGAGGRDASSDVTSMTGDGEAGSGAGGSGGRADGSGAAGSGAAGSGAAGSGGLGSGAAGSGGGSGARGSSSRSDEAGCACSAPGAPHGRTWNLGAIAALALGVHARRRSRRVQR